MSQHDDLPDGCLMLVASSARDGYGVLRTNEDYVLLRPRQPDEGRMCRVRPDRLARLFDSDASLRSLAEPRIFRSAADVVAHLGVLRAREWISDALVDLLSGAWNETLPEHPVHDACLRAIDDLFVTLPDFDLPVHQILVASQIGSDLAPLIRTWEHAIRFDGRGVHQVLAHLTAYLIDRGSPIEERALQRLHNVLSEAQWPERGVVGSAHLMWTLEHILGLEPRDVAAQHELDRNHGMRWYMPGVVVAGYPYEPVWVLGAAVRRVLEQAGVDASGDFLEALDKQVRSLVEAAIGRALANSREMVLPCDL